MVRLARKRFLMGPAGRRVKRRISLRAARAANSRLRMIKRVRFARRAASWGLKGLAVGAAAKYIIGKARRVRSARKTEVFKDYSVFNTRTLYQHSLTDIARGTGIDQRTEDDIRVAGYRIKGEIVNNQAGPLYVNIAVVSHRDSGNTLEHEFFRHDGSVKAIDFSVTLSSLELHGNPLNTDKFAILKHRRYLLNCNATVGGGPNGEGSGKTYMNIDWYVPIQRNLQFDSNASTSIDASSNIHLIWWTDDWITEAGTTAQGAAGVAQWKVVAYHHDT